MNLNFKKYTQRQVINQLWRKVTKDDFEDGRVWVIRPLDNSPSLAKIEWSDKYDQYIFHYFYGATSRGATAPHSHGDIRNTAAFIPLRVIGKFGELEII